MNATVRHTTIVPAAPSKQAQLDALADQLGYSTSDMFLALEAKLRREGNPDMADMVYGLFDLVDHSAVTDPVQIEDTMSGFEDVTNNFRQRWEATADWEN